MGQLIFFMREVVTNLRRSPLVCLAAITTVMVLVLLLGIFGILLLNLEHIAKELVGEVKVVAYLVDDLPADKAQQVHKEILKIAHVEGAAFVDKDTALKRLLKRMNGRLAEGDLTRNPLPDSYEIRVDDAQFLRAVADKVRLMDSVQKVKYGEAVAHRMMAFNQVLRTVGLGVLGVLFASTVLVISNTIRLTVFSRRKEIEVMQMVGAARWFIQIPFVLEGLIQSLLGAGLATTLVSYSYELLVPHMRGAVPFLPVLGPAEVLPTLVPALIGLGAFVGALGSLISVNRYLKI